MNNNKIPQIIRSCKTGNFFTYVNYYNFVHSKEFLHIWRSLSGDVSFHISSHRKDSVNLIDSVQNCTTKLHELFYIKER